MDFTAVMLGYDDLVKKLSVGWKRATILNAVEAAAQGIGSGPRLEGPEPLYAVFVRGKAWVAIPVAREMLDDMEDDVLVEVLHARAEAQWQHQMEKVTDARD